MGMIDRLARAMGYERRSADPSWAALGAALGTAPALGARAAENFATVAACVSAIASPLAGVPVWLYRRDGGRRVEVEGHPLASLVAEGVSPTQTWPEFLESLIASTLLQGNALAEIERDEAGQLAGLRFLPWGTVSVQTAPSGRLVYDVAEQTGLGGATGRMRRLLAGDVVHLKDRSDDGQIGRSRLSRSADTVAAALQVNAFANGFLANGAQPSGALESEEPLSAEAMAALRAQLEERHAGAANAGRVMLLQGGLKFTPFQISPEDAELLATRKFAVEEICRLYQVPPPLVQDYSYNTFTNAETAGRWFAQFTLSPWARKIEAAFSRALFPAGSGLEIELDLSGFLRGDPQTRWAAHKIAVEGGILTADEVREIEGFDPRPTVAVA